MIKNAIIKDTFLGFDDHGILTFYITLDYGGSCQSFGGRGLCMPKFDHENRYICRVGSAFGTELILQTLKVLEVDNWEKLKGLSCRADVVNGSISSIGHYLKDNWVNPDSIAAYMDGR